MNHKHFDEISSTQTFLLDNSSYQIVSAKRQTLGRGRGNNSWDSYDNSLAFSFNLSPSHTKTLTSLEIAVHICEFIEEADLRLKWPNDILTKDGRKCGGILLQLNDDKLVVGVGLNWGKSKENTTQYKTGKSHITDVTLVDKDYKSIPEAIYGHILSNRLSDQQIITKWNRLCFHTDKEVSIIDTQEDRGVFKKIGPYGEAYLDIDGNLQKFFTGSLIIH